MKIASPGIAIAKVWPGQVELFLRVGVTLCSIATLITSILTLDHVQDNFSPSIPTFLNDLIEKLIGVSYNTLVGNSTSAAKIGISLACIALLYEIILIIIRFVNISFINTRSKIFFAIDVVISFILSAIFGVVGILAAHTASKWADLVGNDQQFKEKVLPKTRDLLAVLAACSLFGALFMALLTVWLILFLLKNWNSKIVVINNKGSAI